MTRVRTLVVTGLVTLSGVQPRQGSEISGKGVLKV